MSQNKEGTETQKQYKHTTGVEAQAKTQEEYCRTARSSVKSGRSKQASVEG